MTTNCRHIFFVDDESAVCRTVSQTLRREGYKVSCFPDAEHCLQRLQMRDCDLLITDVRMPGVDGIELVRRAKSIIPWVPILVVTGYADIQMAVRAVKAGAAEFIEKPLQKQSFLSAVKTVLKQQDLGSLLKGKSLTKKETVVLRLILQGHSNRRMAQILHRSVRTIEDHRRNVMCKLDVDSIVELVKRAVALGLTGKKRAVKTEKHF
ncbi:MAG: response regulator transcription factor [Sedimentisphaerales bacterium]|nr:response regulator transcription factor [Sedimentisphaerales bacterium]